MKPAIATGILAASLLFAGCGAGDEANGRKAALNVERAPTTADTPVSVADWPLPATLPGSALPDLVLAPDGNLLLAWTNSRQGRRHILQFSSFDPTLSRWMHAPTTIAVGNSMFVNWADTPHIMATPDGALWVHWLQKSADAPYAYDVVVSTSRNGGARWSAPLMPHNDGTQTEHGFVSMWPQSRDALGIAWLDGRNTGGGGHDTHVGGGAMTLRAASIGADLRVRDDVQLDAMTCDCCQTGVAMTARGPLLVYRGRTPDETRDIYATRLEGGTWTTPARVHADDWTMPACPVNGPAVAAAGDAVVAGWYTAPDNVPAVRLARSDDAGDSFGAPVVLDRGDAVQGRVQVALDGDQAWALWVREDGDGQSLWLSRRSADLATEHQRLELAKLQGRGRATGFPQLVLRDGVGYVVWTDVVDGAPGLRGAIVAAR
ncbi:hypothetical protein [Luteimonas vadosa]|uniref:Exo-alpha-sialidase n=1 Tax=Luteimonas vadosa TaxID=1165507 RepID=A0ABP9DS80_9GAMM